MKNKTCCFSGHRIIPSEEKKKIQKTLKNKIIELIDSGVIYFGTGGALGFDTIVAKTILKLKKSYPQIKLIIVIPCLEQQKFWSVKDKIQYEIIKKSADKIKILSDKYYKGCMQQRNRHLVDNSSYLICYKRKNTGGTVYTYNYAKKKNLHIIEI